MRQWGVRGNVNLPALPFRRAQHAGDFVQGAARARSTRNRCSLDEPRGDTTRAAYLAYAFKSISSVGFWADLFRVPGGDNRFLMN
jgi:hypothetical protein